MTNCVDHTGRVKVISKLATLILILTFLGLIIYGVDQIDSIPRLIVIVGLMVFFSFGYCAYETAIARFEETWRDNPKTNAITDWFKNFEQNSPSDIWGKWSHHLKTASFFLCNSYLGNPPRSFASLLALGAFVDIAGTVIVTHHITTGRIPGPVLETIIVTIPLVIAGHLFGTIIGMQRPVKILIWLAIPIWFSYFPASLIVSIIANYTKWFADRFKSDPGY